MATRTLTRRRAAQTEYTPEQVEEDFAETTEEQEETPARGSRRGSRRALPAQRTAPVEDDEDGDEEETPRARARKAEPSDAPKASGGWGTYSKQKSESGDFPENLKITDEQVLIKFLEDEPFVVYKQHWIERTGKKSFTCLENGCPLCDDLGDRPRLQVSFNVVDLSSDPEIKIWTVGTRVAGQLKKFSQDKKTSPLSKEGLYWAVSKSGKGSDTTYSIVPTKERDLVEDWDIEPLSAAEVQEFEGNVYGPSVVQYQTKKQLREVADESLDD